MIEAGAAVSGLSPGDLVVPMVRRPCARPECRACRSGHPDFCETGAYTERGIVGAHGFLAEEVVEDERYLVRLAPELRAVGVLTEPLTIAEKALRQFLEVRRRLPWLAKPSSAELLQGGSALVLGAGPVGLLGCMLLRLRGLDRHGVLPGRRGATPARCSVRAARRHLSLLGRGAGLRAGAASGRRSTWSTRPRALPSSPSMRWSSSAPTACSSSPACRGASTASRWRATRSCGISSSATRPCSAP